LKTVQVIWTNEAIVDLEIIHDFIAQKSSSAALKRVGQIESFPESGSKALFARSTIREYRYLVEGKYKIIYSYQREVQIVYIETIFDTRHDPTEARI